MFTEDNLRELLEFSAPEPVISVYLNTEPSAGNADAYRLRLRTMLKEAKLPQEAAASVAAIERYFIQDYNWTGRSIAVFSCAPKGFFRAYTLAVPVRDLVRISDHPTVKPLTDLIDIYGSYGVVLVDQQGARLFVFNLGELKEQEGVLGEAVKHTKRGGSSSMVGMRGGMAGKTRAAEETVDRNMKEIAEFVTRFFEEKHVRRILIGGTEDTIAQLRSELPKAWQSLIAGTFPMSMTASHPEVLNRALQVGMEAEERRENHLVDNLITSAAKGNDAVVGFRDTLTAANDGRIQTLLISDGYRQPGYYCPSCQHLSLAEEECPNDGQKVVQVPDAVELAVHSVLRHKGSVEIVHTGTPLDQCGSIGAILRYSV
jgi:peptide subunit release factor 1 (eRF1)